MIATGLKDEMLRGDHPPDIRVNIAGIPKLLRQSKRCVLWSFKWNGSKWTKVPKQPNGQNASSTDPATWTDFTTTVQAHQQTGNGLGFILNGDGLVCLDLDNVRDPRTGTIVPWAQEIIATAGSYAEVSPTGTGVKVYILGKFVEGTKRKYQHPEGYGDVETFDNKRFLCLTGDHIPGTPTEIQENQSGLNIVCRMLKSWKPARQNRVEQPAANHHNSDDVETALAALDALDPDMGYTDWMAVGMALHAVDTSLLSAWDRWSRGSTKYIEGEPERKWKSFTAGRGVGIGTLCMLADQTGKRWRPERRNGWRPNSEQAQARLALHEVQPATNETLTIRSPEGQTELAHSRRFVACHGNDFRYVPKWGSWLHYDQGRWNEDTGNVHATQGVKGITEDLWDEVKTHPANDSIAYVKRMGKHAAARDTLAWAASDLAINHTVLDADPWLLNCPNGTLDLRTGELREHRREDLLTKSVRVPFNPRATCLTWERFIGEVFPSVRLAEFVQRLAGYCLTGDVSEQVLPIFHGCGANGKSTLLTALQYVFGDYAGQAPSGMLALKKYESHPTEVAGLFGKRFVVTSETEGNCRLAESLVKQLTGGDVITARRMRENFWEFRPTHKLLLCTNHKPIIRGTDHGIWRRLLLVQFDQVFDGPRKDPQLPDKLAAEADGILAWCVRGCLEWQRDGLKPPEEVRAATDAYKTQEDIVGRFVQECCDVGESRMRCRFTDLYTAFRNWCEEGGERCPSSKAVGQWLLDNSFEKHRSGGVLYHGIELRGL